MNLSTVLRIIVSCLLNAVVAWTVDYYATSLLSRRDVFKTGRKPKIFTVQWLAFTLMLCGFALLPSGLNEAWKFPVICIKAVCYIVLFELLYEGSFLKKLLMAVSYLVIMLGGEFIMSRAFIAAGLAMRRVPNMLFGSITGVQKLKLSLLPILSAVLMILFLLIAFKIVPLVSTVSALLIPFALLTILSIGFQFRLLSNISVAQKQMADNEEEARKAQFELQLGVQQAGHAEDVHRIEQNMRANIRRLRKLNAEGKRDEIKEFIEKITHIMKQNRVEIPLSGVSVIDEIMWAKIDAMKKAGIESDYETEKLNADSIAISDAELCALLANALDNAIEGTQRLLDGEPKKIFVRIRQTECALEITVRNPCEAKQTVEMAFIQSARRAAGSRGYGMGNMKRICRENGGEFLPNVQNGEFEVFISLPFGK